MWGEVNTFMFFSSSSSSSSGATNTHSTRPVLLLPTCIYHTYVYDTHTCWSFSGELLLSFRALGRERRSGGGNELSSWLPLFSPPNNFSTMEYSPHPYTSKRTLTMFRNAHTKGWFDPISRIRPLLTAVESDNKKIVPHVQAQAKHV